MSHSESQQPASPDFVKKPRSALSLTDSALECARNSDRCVRNSDHESVEAKALPLGFLLRGPNPGSPADRVLARLIQQEAHERKVGHVHFAEDLRQAQIAILRWQRGDFPTFAECFVSASYTVFSCHPDRLFEKMVARRRSQLGAEYSRWYDERGNLCPDLFVVHSFGVGLSPKKPAQSDQSLRSGGERKDCKG